MVYQWLIFALLAAVFTALRGIFGKKVMEHEHALEYGASQSVISLVFLLIALPFFWMNLPWQYWLVAYVTSVVFTAGNLYYLKSIRHSELSSTIPLMNLSPLFLLVIAYLLLGEEPSVSSVIGVLLLLSGTYVLQMGTSKHKHGLLYPFKKLAKSRYPLYMVFAMLIYSFTATMEKGIVNTDVIITMSDVIFLFILIRIFVSLNYIILEWIKHGFPEMLKDLKTDTMGLLGSSVTSLLSIFFHYLALGSPGALVSLIVPVKRLSTLMSTLVGGTFFHEQHLKAKIIACAIMLAGVVLIVL